MENQQTVFALHESFSISVPGCQSFHFHPPSFPSLPPTRPQLFPIYFAWSSFTLAMQLLTGSAMGLPVKAMQWLGASLATSLVNSLFLEPAATKVMFERYALEKQNKKDAPEYKVLAKKFNGLHGMSSLVNLVAVVGGFVHAYYLALLFV